MQSFAACSFLHHLNQLRSIDFFANYLPLPVMLFCIKCLFFFLFFSPLTCLFQFRFVLFCCCLLFHLRTDNLCANVFQLWWSYTRARIIYAKQTSNIEYVWNLCFHIHRARLCRIAIDREQCWIVCFWMMLMFFSSSHFSLHKFVEQNCCWHNDCLWFLRAHRNIYFHSFFFTLSLSLVWIYFLKNCVVSVWVVDFFFR